MEIPLTDMRFIYAQLGEEINEAVREVLRLAVHPWPHRLKAGTGSSRILRDRFRNRGGQRDGRPDSFITGRGGWPG